MVRQADTNTIPTL